MPLLEMGKLRRGEVKSLARDYNRSREEPRSLLATHATLPVAGKPGTGKAGGCPAPLPAPPFHCPPKAPVATSLPALNSPVLTK